MRYKNATKSKNNGVVYTPLALATYVAHEIVNQFELDVNQDTIKILDPSLGEAVLALALIKAVKDKYPTVRIEVYGYDIDSKSVEKSISIIRTASPDVSIYFQSTNFLEDKNIVKNVDIVIANPPYVRTQILGEETSKKISEKFGLKGKLDIYYAFFIVALETLRVGGVAGFITSNKYLTIGSGKTLRQHLYRNSKILTITDFGDCRVFNAAVLPCVTVFKKTDGTFLDVYKVKFNSIYLSKESNEKKQYLPVNSVYECIDKNGFFINEKSMRFEAKTGYTFLSPSSYQEPWVLNNSEDESWLKNIEENTWKTFDQVATVRVGIKTTADNVFLFEQKYSSVDLELMKPLITHRNAQSYLPKDSPQWSVLYPHYELNGKRLTYDLNKYPKTKTFLLKHYEQLSAREYVKKAHREWFEIWVPQKPSMWAHRKIVFRDISEYPEFWLVKEDAVINGDCYWIEFPEETTDDIVYLMLAVANSPFILKFYDKKFNTKLYCSKRRFMTQYVKQFPIPDANSRECKKIISLVKQLIDSHTLDLRLKNEIDSLVELVFSQKN